MSGFVNPNFRSIPAAPDSQPDMIQRTINADAGIHRPVLSYNMKILFIHMLKMI